MVPTLQDGQLIIVGAPKRVSVGTVVVVQHNGLDKIKRVTQMKDDQLYIAGDNPSESTDSRTFGWIDETSVIATVVWPKVSRF